MTNYLTVGTKNKIQLTSPYLYRVLPPSPPTSISSKYSLLCSLPSSRYSKPAYSHSTKQSDSNGVKDEGSRGLSKETGGERRDSAAGAAEGGDDAEAADLLLARQVAGEDGGGAGVDRAKEKTDNGERDGLADDVGHEPHEQLEDSRAGREAVHEPLLADARPDRRQREPP